ncbi:MAG: O-succinylbenzoate--CoA ligase [Solirubrobacterales bacterium]|nr:O-succinylbenzoate--CoA ligase [Solirubrobacterales bacterium]
MAPQDWAALVQQLASPDQRDWVALEHASGQMTIKELCDGMLRAATVLAEGEGVVAVSETDPLAHTVAVLGAVAAGRVAMLVDAKGPDALLAEVVERSGATTVVGRAVPGVTSLGLEDLLAGAPAPALAPRSPEDTGSIFLTSGSTGVPKLVLRPRGADLHAAMCMRLSNFPIDPGDRHWLCVPYAGAPFLTLVMGALFARATVVFAPFVREEIDGFLAEQRISSAYLVPTMLRLVREHSGLDGPGWRGLRALMTGGEKLDLPTAEVLLEQFDGRVYCSYGMTELPRPTEATFEEIAARPGTVGRPIPFRRVRITEVDGEGDLPVGEEGEVLVTGPDLFTGYLGEEPVGEWYRTGDLGRLDEEGFLYITGRASSVVKVGGNRVSTEEVAAALRRHEAVGQAAVIAVDDAVWTTRLEAFVVLRAGAESDADTLRGWLGERMPAYKVPRSLRFIDEMPVDSSGKLSLQTLKALVSD